MKRFHDTMQVTVSFSFTETSPATPIEYSKSGQAIQPPEGPEFELEEFCVDIVDHRCDESSVTLFEEMENTIREYIEHNYKELTSN